MDAGAPPIAHVVAATLRRAAGDAKLSGHLASLRGRFAIRSAKDPQSATIRFAEGGVDVVGGVDADADVVVTADLDTLGKPGAPKPKVKGAAKRPLFALRASQVLDAKPSGDWRDAVHDFVARAAGRPGLPDPLLVVSTEGGEVRIGGAGRAQLEVHGTPAQLQAIFTGDGITPAQAWFEGKIQCLGDQATLQRFEGLGQALMFGG